MQVDGWWVPFDNAVTRRNLQVPSDIYPQVLSVVKGRNQALDCGAFVGTWTREMLKDFASVVAVEMDPVNAACLEKNAPGARVIQGALTDKIGPVHYGPDEYPDSPIYCASDDGKKVAEPVLIDSLGLSPDLIKLDIQGYETFALRGARETLLRCKPVLFFEHKAKCLHRYGLDGSELTTFLTELGAHQMARFGADRLWGW